MNERDELIDLIYSLSPPEKRYIRIFAEKHLIGNQNIYLNLFDKLLTVHAPSNALKKISSSHKNYLFNFILKAMRSFHEGKNVDIMLKELLINVHFLFEKKLHKQASKQLRRAKELAKQFDKQNILLEILQWETSLQLEYINKQQREKLAGSHAEIVGVLTNIHQDWPFIFLQQEMLLFDQMKQPLTDDERKNYAAQLEQLVAVARSSSRFDPQHHAFFALALYHSNLCEYALSANAYEELLALWEKWPVRLEAESILYKKIISNYLVVCHHLERFDKYPILLELIRSIPCRNVEEEAEQFQHLQLLELLFLMNTDGYDRLGKFAEEIKEGLHRFRNKINKARELLFYHNMAIAFFLKHDWKASFEWLTKIINDEKSEHRIDIQNFARILRLVLWYEMGKHDLLEYELINAERFLRTRKSWQSFESLMVRHVNRLLSSEGKNRQKLFEQFQEKISSLLHDKKMGIQEIYLWVRSHQENKTMRELLLLVNS